jgi:hypothetical protein
MQIDVAADSQYPETRLGIGSAALLEFSIKVLEAF